MWSKIQNNNPLWDYAKVTELLLLFFVLSTFCLLLMNKYLKKCPFLSIKSLAKLANHCITIKAEPKDQITILLFFFVMWLNPNVKWTQPFRYSQHIHQELAFFKIARLHCFPSTILRHSTGWKEGGINQSTWTYIVH